MRKMIIFLLWGLLFIGMPLKASAWSSFENMADSPGTGHIPLRSIPLIDGFPLSATQSQEGTSAKLLNDNLDLDANLASYNSLNNLSMGYFDPSQPLDSSKTKIPEPSSLTLLASGLILLFRKRMNSIF